MKPRFQIGDYVVCRATVTFGYTGKNKRVMERVERETRGWVVGMTLRQEGTISGEGSYAAGYYGEQKYDPPYLEVSKTRRVWKVAAGLSNRPVEVLGEDMPAAPSQPPGPCPARAVTMDEKTREMMRRESRNWPRDARGRFVQDPPAKKVAT